MRFWPRKQVYLDDLPRTHDFRFAVLFVCLFVGVIGAVYAVGYFVAGDRLATGTTVAGVDVGGMRRDEARTTLQEKLAPRLEQPVKMTGLGQTFEVDPQTAGITIDLEASVDKGLGSSPWDPSHMLEVVVGGESHDAVVELNEEEFKAAVDAIAAKVERPAQDAAVTIALRPSVRPGVNGVQIDRLALAKAMQTAVLAGTTTISLPIEAVEPAITTTDASDFVSEVAGPAVGRDIRIRVADTALTVRPQVFAPALTAAGESGDLHLTADPAALMARSRGVLAQLPHKPVNAKVVFGNGRPVVVASRSGTTVTADDWASAVLAAVSKRGDNRRAVAVVTEDAPRFSTQNARQLEIRERVGVAEVRVPGSLDEAAVQRAVRQLDGSLVLPQESLSVLRSTSAIASDELSLVAGALFDSSFHTGLATVERHEPAVHKTGAPGLDAAAGPGSDLVIQNDTPFGILVHATIGGVPTPTVRLELWGSKYWDVRVAPGTEYDVVRPGVQRERGPSCRPRAGVAGFTIDVSRTLQADGVGHSDRDRSQPLSASGSDRLPSLSQGAGVR